MPYLVVTYETLERSINVPDALKPYLTHQMWGDLRDKNNHATSNGNCLACLGEVGCCLCFGGIFIFVFCCHGIFSKNIKESFLRDELIILNSRYFNNAPVLSIREASGITLNTDLIPTHLPQIIPSHMADAVYATQFPPPAVAHAVPQQFPHQSRQMVVILPPNAVPGTQMTVLSPDGLQVQVLIPFEECYPGKQITVEY